MSKPTFDPDVPLHLCVVQPRGECAALAGLDAALLARRQFAAIGLACSLGRHTTRPDALNLVFGAEWGFDADAAAGHACVLVGAEPGAGDASADGSSAAARRLWQALPSIACEPVAADAAAATPVWPCGLAGAARPSAEDLAKRPIDLLLLQPVTPQRLALMQRIEAAGARIARADAHLAADERAGLVRQARAVLLLRGHGAERVSRIAAALAWAEGTPVVVEGTPADWGGDQAAAAVQWFTPAMIEEFFGAHRHTAQAQTDAARSLEMAQVGAADAARDLWARMQALARPVASQATPLVRLQHRPQSGTQRWGALRGWQPADAAAPGGGTADLIHAGAHDLDDDHLARLMAQALPQVRIGGTLVLEVRLEGQAAPRKALHAAVARITMPGLHGSDLIARWQLGHTGWLDDAARPLPAAEAAAATWARLAFTKVETSYRERTQARAWLDDFGLAATPV